MPQSPQCRVDLHLLYKNPRIVQIAPTIRDSPDPYISCTASQSELDGATASRLAISILDRWPRRFEGLLTPEQIPAASRLKIRFQGSALRVT